MKLVFMGTPAFAVPSLDAVLATGDIAAVVTRPDKPRGRGLRVTSPPVAVAAAQYGLDVLQPVVHGERDPRPARVARQLAEFIPSASYVELPQVGHLPWLEHPDLLRGVLRRFLERLSWWK